MATPFTCTFRVGWQGCSSIKPAFNFSIRSSVAFIVPSIVSRITLNHVITWRGSQRDFSSLGTNPDLSKSEWTTKLLTLAETKSVPPPKPLSRKIAIEMPWLLHDFCNGFKIDVKYTGLKKTRKGAQRLYELWKFLVLKISWNPVPKIPSKSEKFSVVRENFNVVVTRLKIKFIQVIITIKQLRNDTQIFAFKPLLVNKPVDIAKIQNEPLLSRTTGRNWKRVNDIAVTSKLFNLV